MRADKHQALKLRLAGKSYHEIGKSLGVPKSTLSGWFSNLILSSRAEQRLAKRVRMGSMRGLLKRNKDQTRLARARAKRIRELAAQEVAQLDQTGLKLVGIALYWAEGYKRPVVRNGREATYHSVALSNSDPALVALFLRFLREICDVTDDSIAAEIRIYQHINANRALNYWKNVTKLPTDNFRKSYYGISKSSLGKRPFNRLPYGTVMIRVNNTALYHKIMGWIQGLINVGLS